MKVLPAIGVKGSKWKKFDDEDNQDINGGDTSNAFDDDNLGINSHGSSQGLSQSFGICNKPCSSTLSSAASPPHSYENDGTMMVLPTSSQTNEKKAVFEEVRNYHPDEESSD